MYRTQGPDATTFGIQFLQVLQGTSAIFGGLQSDWTSSSHCARPHAPDWFKAELLVVQMAGDTQFENRHGLYGGKADLPFVGYYHQYRWQSATPAPPQYGQMIVAATSRRANIKRTAARNVTPHQQDQGRHSGTCHPTKTSHRIDPMVDLPAMQRGVRPHQCRLQSKHSARPRR